ncbi:MAG: mechanosensitive ion channel domain-containing protein [Planctomycetota bacterium]|jgi:potassium efflux system protein
MKLNFDRWRGVLRGLLAGWILLAGTPVLEAQESQEVPTREALEQQLAEVEDQKSEEAKLFQEALEHLSSREAALAKAAEYTSELEQFPAREAELNEQLIQELPDADLTIPPGLTSEEVQSRAAEYQLAAVEAEAEDSTKKGVLDGTERELEKIPLRLKEARDELEAAQEAHIDALATDASQGAIADTLTRSAWRQAEVAALEAKQPAFEARRTIYSLERDLTQRASERAQEVADAWNTEAEKRRQLVNAQEARTLRETVTDLIARHPELEPYREPFETLAELRSGERSVLERKSKEQAALEGVEETLEEVRLRYESARRRQSISGTTELLGLVLRRDYESLPRPAALRAQLRKVEQQLVNAEIDDLDLYEENSLLDDTSFETEELFGPQATDAQRKAKLQIENLEKQTIRDLRNDLRELIKTFEQHRDTLRTLELESAAYRDFIERRILWVRSTDFDPWSMVTSVPSSALGASTQLSADLADGRWIQAGNTRLRTLLTGSAVAIALLALRRVLLRKREEFGGMVRSYRTDRFILTVRAAAQTLLLALPLPLLAWTLGTGLDHAPTQLLRAAGEGLREAAWVWWVLRTAKGICVPKGLGQAHFRWPSLGVRALERELLWFTPLTVSLTWVFVTLTRQSNSEWSDSLGRCAFIVTMLAFALFGRRLLREKSPLWSGEDAGLLGRGRGAWFALATVLPTALALAAFSGFYYTALEFELRLRWSLGLGFVLLLLNALLSRWLFHSRRKLAVRQAIEARAQREREAEAGSEEAQEASRMAFDAERVDIPDVDAKTRQLFRTSLTLASVIGLYLLWASALPALRGLDRVQIWPSLQIVEVEELAAPSATPPPTGVEAEAAEEDGESSPVVLPAAALMSASNSGASEDASGLGLATQVTLADVLLALLFGLLTAVFSKNLPALLELAILQRLPLDSGARYAIATIARYLILVIGISATSSALGIGWQKIQWLAAALTFGLAFGLQEIFANFVSGLILLLERPIRVGDIVTVGTTEGRVTQLQMRATTIQDWNRRELLVPNKDFITGHVINWTLTDPVTRVVIPVGIAYGSDVALARKLLLDIAQKNTLVMKDPKPQAVFLNFGASSLDLQLRVFITNRDVWADLMDSLHSSIDAAFRRANIEISFPQQDLHLRSVDEDFVLKLRSEGQDAPPPATD